ncbi:MAG: biotin transporter BioY [Candidatus Sericytochromatia bacterium]
MLNLLIALTLFLLLVLSTFFVIDLPFITFIFANIPESVNIVYQNSLLAIGTYSGSLQIPVIILSSLLLNPKLNFIFIMTYFCIGFYSKPIFYSGGGKEYFEQPTIGYLLSFLLVTILISKYVWKDHNYNKYLLNTRYTFFISFMGLLLIHFIGITTAFLFVNNNHKFLNMFQSFFYIPFLSQLMLIAVACILAKYINIVKFYLVNKYRNLNKAIRKSTRRRKLSTNYKKQRV